MLSARENTCRLFSGQGYERVGFNDGLWDATLKNWGRQGYPKRKVRRKVKERAVVDGKEIEQEVEQEVEELVPAGEHLGFDMAGCGGWYDMMALRNVNELVEENEEWRVVRNGMGAALKWWKNKDGTPEHVDFRMRSREIWERDYRPHVTGIDRSRINIAETKQAIEWVRQSGKWGHLGTLFIWEHARRSFGDLGLYESLVLDPGWVRDFNRVYTDHLIGHYQILLAEGGVPDGMWLYEDLGFKERLFCSPKTLADLVFPYYKEVVDFMHSHGLKVVLHSCGFTMEALPLIVWAGFDGLHPMEVAAGNEIFKAAEQYGDKLVFVGGFDKRLLETHDHDLIRRETTRFIEGMKERGARFLFGSDHSISTNVNYADYLCMLNAYREHMLY